MGDGVEEDLVTSRNASQSALSGPRSHREVASSTHDAAEPAPTDGDRRWVESAPFVPCIRDDDCCEGVGDDAIGEEP